MILVTVGTHNAGFDRLVRAMDMLAAELTEEVIVQYGSSTYIPQHATAFQWGTSEQMMELTRQARVIVSHAAAGSILNALKACKPLVVIPREKAFGEVVDNHQYQLARALSADKRAVMLTELDPRQLQVAIDQAAAYQPHGEGGKLLVEALREKLRNWDR